MGSPEYLFYLFLYERTSQDQVTVFQEPRANGIEIVISHFFVFFCKILRLSAFSIIELEYMYLFLDILVERGKIYLGSSESLELKELIVISFI